jgi:Fe-S-cluster containining protein
LKFHRYLNPTPPATTLTPPDCHPSLSKEEFITYNSMIGADDWCINYDKEARMCKIYETRPGFCVVDPRKFKTMFGVEQEDLNVSA